MVELSPRRERSEEMGEIFMRNWDLENFVCESIDHALYSRYESQSGG